MITSTSGKAHIVNTAAAETGKIALVARLLHEKHITIEEMTVLLKPDIATNQPVENNFIPLQHWKNNLWMQDKQSVNSTGQITP